MTLAAINISKTYGDLRVLDKVSFAVPSGRLLAIVGPSGCGKTTLLNLIAGLDDTDDGRIDVEEGRRISYMMQDPLLLPWRTLAENALLGAEVASGKTTANSLAVEKNFLDFDLSDTLNTYPKAASGGMKQRVALIRTLLTKPSMLLLDEPFSNLDFDVKLLVQRYLIEYQQREGTTILLVTHDIEDAIALSDEVVVFSDKPTTVKAVIPIDLGFSTHDPIRARKSPRFTEYFTRIWEEIRYLDEE